MNKNQKRNLELIRNYKGTVADFKSFWDTQANTDTNAFNTPEYQGFDNVHPTRGANKSPHWNETNESNSDYEFIELDEEE